MSAKDMNYEQNRLDTFPSNWQHPFVKKETLAKTGLYFVGLPDYVKCQFCGVDLHKFDNKFVEVPLHVCVCLSIIMKKRCPLIFNLPNENVPLDPSNSELKELTSYLFETSYEKRLENMCKVWPTTNVELSTWPSTSHSDVDRDGDKKSNAPSGECCCNCPAPKRKNPKSNE